MSISLITSNEVSEIKKEGFSESLQKLENMLEAGMPIMLQNYNWNDIAMGGGKRTNRVLFFSNGNLNTRGEFNIQKGKRNFSYLLINKDPTSYRIVNNQKEELDHHKLKIPRSWTMDQYNEGTFSPAPPSSWKSNHKSGTEKIMVGDIIAEQFPDALEALKFARNATQFNLHPFYSMQNYLVTEMGDKGSFSKQAEQRTQKTHDIACLKASINLLQEANQEINEYFFGLVAKQVGYYGNGKEKFREKGQPADKKDYLVKELSHPQRNIALVKTGKGAIYGETYVLPFNEKMNGVVESAFAEERIKKHYPYGFKDS